MKRLKKSMSMLLALLMLLGIFASVSVTAGAKETKKSKTGGMFPTITLTGDNDVDILNWEGVHNDAYSGVKYDKTTNTLTLDNVDALGTYGLETYFMNKDFKIEVIGNCSLNRIVMNDGCLSITGGGKLTVGNNVKYGVYFAPCAEDYYPSALSISESVSFKASGKASAICFNKSSCDDKDKLATAAGKTIDGFETKNEYKDGEKKKINAMYYNEGYSYYYLASASSDPEGTYCVYLDDDEYGWVYVVQKCDYNEALGGYVIDDSFSAKYIDEDDFDEDDE